MKNARVYYGEYEEFDSIGHRAGLYANVAQDTQGKTLFFKLGDTLITSTQDSFTSSEAQTRFLITTQEAGKLYGMYFSNTQAYSDANIASFAFEAQAPETLSISNLSHSQESIAFFALGQTEIDLGSYALNIDAISGSKAYALYFQEGNITLKGSQAISIGTLKRQTAGHLLTTQKGIHTLRTRAGLNLGFDFKEFFKHNEKANATLYLGTYYTYDYIQGGDLRFDNLGGYSLDCSPYESTGRLVLNVGTSISLNEEMRFYLDFERSFFGKLTTEYQVNAGFRFGLGEKQKEKQKEINSAPLKLQSEEKIK